jgi:hypothetical protein
MQQSMHIRITGLLAVCVQLYLRNCGERGIIVFGSVDRRVHLAETSDNGFAISIVRWFGHI